MSDPQKALATQLANIQARTGRSLDELTALVRDSGLTKHGEIRDLPSSERLKVMPEKSMCRYTVRLGDTNEVDAELAGWLRQAYDEAG